MYSHGHESQNEQIDAGSHDGQSEEDEDQTQSHVTRLVAQSMIILKNNFA